MFYCWLGVWLPVPLYLLYDNWCVVQAKIKVLLIWFWGIQTVEPEEPAEVNALTRIETYLLQRYDWLEMDQTLDLVEFSLKNYLPLIE